MINPPVIRMYVHSLKIMREIYRQSPTTRMEEEDTTDVPNRKGGQNLKVSEGYVYKRTKTFPLNGKNCWNCMSRQRFDSSVALFTLLHHLDTETAEGRITAGRTFSVQIMFHSTFGNFLPSVKYPNTCVNICPVQCCTTLLPCVQSLS